MRTRRLSIQGTVIVFVVAVVASIGLATSGIQASPTTNDTGPPSLNRMEHEAHRSLYDTRREQAQTLNPYEHLGLRDVNEAARVNRLPVSTNRLNRCAVGLAQAWRDLGHFSDGYESYLLRQPPCS